MAVSRMLLALWIAAAVAVAPVGAALTSTHASAGIAKSDCGGMSAKDCLDCTRPVKTQAKCPGDGSKCCKLTGVIESLPMALAIVVGLDRVPNPQEPPRRPLQPLTPPPRS
jgi:hypothetical protein